MDKASFFRPGLRQEKSIYCGLSFNRFAGFFSLPRCMNEGDPKNREHWVQIINTTPIISSTDHSPSQTTDKRIITIEIMLFEKHKNLIPSSFQRGGSIIKS